MANQFTKAEAEGKPKPKGTNQFIKGTREEHDPETRDKIRAEFAAQKLEAHLNGETRLDQIDVAAAKALLPYGKSTLSSVEQTNKEDLPSEADLVGQLAPLIAANPGLKAQLRALLDGSPQPVAVVNDASHQAKIA